VRRPHDAGPDARYAACSDVARHAAGECVECLVDDGCVIGDRRGVTPQDTVLRYPCDTFVVAFALQAWRAVHIEACAEMVWPWVAQIRLAPYSCDWIDNLGRRSPQEIAGLRNPQIGERFTYAAGRALGSIVSVDPGHQLTGQITGACMSYVLQRQPQGTTRLLLKIVMQTNRWVALGVCLGDVVMARRQLLNFKQLAERDNSCGTAST
jgi:hypothetical protein